MPKIPTGIAKFDSAAAHLQALARFLNDQDFAGLGQSRLLQLIVRQADRVPRRLRERAFAMLGAREGVSPESIEEVSTAAIAQWATDLYPRRRYPAVMFGSSNGALLHLAAALGIPWLPQTILTLVRKKHADPEDVRGAMQAERETALRFLAANPDSQLHHLHDPSQDRLMLQLVTYFRSKYRRLPQAYRDFVTRTLEPGGTIYLIECDCRWPATRCGERYLFQFGAIGGPTRDEYIHGSPRVEAFLRRFGSSARAWDPPAPDVDSPEAEWGFEPALREDVLRFAHREGYRVVALRFDEPECASPLVADFHREWYAQRGWPGNRLLVESFVLQEPYWALRTGSVPYWMTFNMQPSLDGLHRYLDESDPYDQIYLMLFAHGVDSIGLPPIDAWREVLARARQEGRFLGLDPRTYPAHFAAFGRYSQDLRRNVATRHPLPESLPLEGVEHYIALNGPRHGVRLEQLT